MDTVGCGSGGCGYWTGCAEAAASSVEDTDDEMVWVGCSDAAVVYEGGGSVLVSAESEPGAAL